MKAKNIALVASLVVEMFCLGAACFLVLFVIYTISTPSIHVLKGGPISAKLERGIWVTYEDGIKPTPRYTGDAITFKGKAPRQFTIDNTSSERQTYWVTTPRGTYPHTIAGTTNEPFLFAGEDEEWTITTHEPKEQVEIELN